VSLPKFLADEDLRFEIVLALRRLETRMEILTAVESGYGGLTDHEVLQFASDAKLLVVSHDVNTMKAAAESRISSGEIMRGLFLVPQSRATRPVVQSLHLIWSHSSAEEWEGQIIYLPF
jgi:hypothetical protein